MTPDAGDPLPPRGPKPKPGPRPLPSSPVDENASTFRPSPKPAARRRTPKAASSRPAEPGNPYRAPEESGRVERGGPSWGERVLFGRVGSTHLATFCRQLANYLDAGVDIIRAMSALEKQFKQTALGPVLGRLGAAIRKGEALSEAMAREPAAFNYLTLSMIRVAEARGGMPEVLRLLATHYENRVRLLRRARSAMIYPAIVLTIAMGVGYLITVFVLPPLVEILVDMSRGKALVLPLPTRMLIGLSHFMTSVGWWVVPLALAGLVFGGLRLYRTGPGKALMDSVALRVPVLGKLMGKLDTTRFARTLSTLLEAGVDYDTSLSLTAEVLHAVPYRRAVRRSRSAVLEGHELSEALDETRRFGVDVIEVLSAGESTGKLPESLEHLADDYEEQVDVMVANLGNLLKPLLTILIGGFAFFIVLGFVMAYVALLSELASGL